MVSLLFKSLCFFLFLAFPLLGSGYLKVAPELSHYVNLIQSFKEGKNLISSVLAKGPINILVAEDSVVKEFSACWDRDNRSILICLSSRPSRGEVIGSLLFELHNALVSEKFDRLDEMALSGQINKQRYIQSIEYLEYLNSLNAAKIAKIAIQKKIFPNNALLPTYRNFEEHFYYQKISGHSGFIAKNYDLLINGFLN